MKATCKRTGFHTIVLLSILLIIVGCSGKTIGNDLVSNDTFQLPNETTNKVEILFWHYSSDKYAGQIKDLAEAFNKRQNRIVVKMLGISDSSKQLTAISGGNPPDVTMTQWNNVIAWANAGAVLNLDNPMRRDGINPDNFIPAAIERMKWNGSYYGIPFMVSAANSLIYNKKAMREAGIDPPQTLEQLLAADQKFTRQDTNGNLIRVGFLPDYPWIDNVFWPVIFGGSWLDEQTGKVTPNRKENVEAIAYERKFYETHGTEAITKFRSGLSERESLQDPLLDGTVGMSIGWEYSYWDYRSEDGPIGTVPFPYPANRPDLKGSGIISPRALFIPKNAKHPDEAWEFIKYLISAETQISFSLRTKTIPAVRSVLDLPNIRNSPEMKVMLPFFDIAKGDSLRGFPNSIYVNDYLDALREETKKALEGLKSPQEAMDQVAKRIQPLAGGSDPPKQN